MDKHAGQDREFIAGVWEKVRILEMQKVEEELIQRNEKRLFWEKGKVGSVLFLLAVLFITPLFLVEGLTMSSVLLCGMILLALSILYEYVLDSMMKRRVSYENRNYPSH